MDTPIQTAPMPSAIELLEDNPSMAGHARASGTSGTNIDHLTVQVAHNLKYQHRWTDMRVHYYFTAHADEPEEKLPRPLISGVPPSRLYVHPNEQLELLRQQKAAGNSNVPELRAEREWVLPTHMKESWSLRRFGDVFDSISFEPNGQDGDRIFGAREVQARAAESPSRRFYAQGEPSTNASVRDVGPANVWRNTKRLLLATLEDDSTVVFYIVHDGLVKPRQN